MKFIPQGTRIWADNKMLHKQGRAADDIPLYPGLIEKEYDTWMRVKLTQKDIDKPLEEIYPDFWVEKSLLVEWEDQIPTQPPAGTISDEQAAQAVVTLLKYCRR